MYRYLVVIEQTPRNYSAYSPDLPGCIAMGKTREQTAEKMHAAIIFHLQGLVEDGEPIPPSRSSAEYVAILPESTV